MIFRRKIYVSNVLNSCLLPYIRPMISIVKYFGALLYSTIQVDKYNFDKCINKFSIKMIKLKTSFLSTKVKRKLIIHDDKGIIIYEHDIDLIFSWI